MKHNRKISVTGLGYVGLPVAVAFGEKGPVIGFDKNKQRIAELKAGHDRTNEFDKKTLEKSKVIFTDDSTLLEKADFHIIAVPTPVDKGKRPDLELLLLASQTVGQHLKPGDIVVYESTVYPGVTEESCIPILEKYSHLCCGKDFTVGYSPERINPSDKAHTFSTITKVVSGQDSKTLEIIADVYASVIKAGVYKAPSIKVAEAAKVIENTQRDLNIALMNELALIFKRLNIDTQEVLAAAKTKWNFLPFQPGLVGGHCIGVDPYYLTYKAEQVDYHPQIILAGRRINDSMGAYIAEQTILQMIHNDISIKKAEIGILGLTFKENCPDIRNSKVIDVITTLKKYGANVHINDPIANPEEVHSAYQLTLTEWEKLPKLNAIVLCVAHHFYQNISTLDYTNKLHDQGVIIDVKSVLPKVEFKAQGIEVWRL